MKKTLIASLFTLLLSINTFAQEKPALANDNEKTLFFSKQPQLNFFQADELDISKSKIVNISYDKYAMKDLGINEKQFLKHIDIFVNHTLDFLEGSPVTGPMLISFSLSAISPKEKDIVCKDTPKKCSMNSIEILLSPEYNHITGPLSSFVLEKLDKEGRNLTDIHHDYSEPIISNFNYIGSMKTIILVNLTPIETPKQEKYLQKFQKEIPDLIYPEGEEFHKKYSELQKKYWEINSKELNNSILDNKEKKQTPDTNENLKSESKPTQTDTSLEEQKLLMEFNQKRQKIAPIIEDNSDNNDFSSRISENNKNI